MKDETKNLKKRKKWPTNIARLIPMYNIFSN